MPCFIFYYSVFQVRAFRCCASCADDRSSSAEVVGQCVQRCMRPVVEAEQQAKQEVQQLQVTKNLLVKY